LSVVFIAGVFIKAYKVFFVHPSAERFDYSISDREFTERSSGSVRTPTADNERRDASTEEKKINLNTASKNELTSLPGIGEGIAEQILLYREERGKFTTVDELKKIKGIGPKKFEKIEPHVVIR